MPGDACLNSFELIAVVTKTWLPQTIGDDQPRPGTSAFQATLIVVDHFVGSVSTADTARPWWPRNCGQVVSTGADGPGTSVVTASRSTSAVRTGQYYPRASPLGLPHTVAGSALRRLAPLRWLASRRSLSGRLA